MKNALKSDSGYDFLRSCLNAAPPSCIAALVLILSSIFPTASKLAVNRAQYKMFFFTGDNEIADIVYILFLAAGFCIALLQFRFLSSKAQTNSVLSMGLSRSTLFKSRVAASMAVMFVSVLVPFTVTLLLNARYVGVEAYTLKTYLLFIFSTFSVMLIGFSVGTFTAVLSGTTVEALASGITLVSFPAVFIYFCYLCCAVFLKGFFSSPTIGTFYPIYKFYYLSPINLIYRDSEKSYGGSSLWTERSVIFSKLFAEDSVYAKSVQTFPFSEFLLFFIWIAVCLIVLLAAYNIIKKRKAERNGFLKSSKVIAGIITSFFVLVAALLGIYFADFITTYQNNAPLKMYSPYDFSKKFILFGIIFICAFIILIVCLLVYYGSFKKIKKVLALAPLAVLVLAVPLCCTLGGFGFRYRIPSADKIESAAITLPYGPSFNGELFAFTSVPFGDFTSKSDINTVIEIHKALTGETDKKSSKKIADYITIEYKLKDGTYFYREYNYISEYALLKTTSLFDSNATEKYLYSQFGDKSTWTTERMEPQLSRLQPPYYDNYKAVPRTINWLSFDNVTISLRATDSFERTDITQKLDSESFDKLLQMYAKDLTLLNAEDFYTPDKPPVGIISLKEKLDPQTEQAMSDQGMESQISHEMYIFSDMNNTVGYLDFLGVYDAFNKNSEIKEINFYTCDKNTIFVQDSSPVKHNFLLRYLITQQFYIKMGHNIEKIDIYSAGSEADLATKPFATYTKKDDIESIRDKLYPYYLTTGQSVSFAEVKYDDNKCALFIVKN